MLTEKEKTLIITLFPFGLILSCIFIYIIFFKDSPVIIFGKEFGNLSKINFYHNENKALDSAWLLKSGFQKEECVDTAFKTLHKLNYENIDGSSRFGQSIWANRDDVTVLIRCTSDVSNIIYFTAYSKNRHLTVKRLRNLQKTFKKFMSDIK